MRYMKIKYMLLTIGSMLIAGLASAEWVLVDDFQDGNVDDWQFDTVNEGAEESLLALPEPFAGGDVSNFVLEMDPGVTLNDGASTGANTRRVRAARAMPAIDGMGTVYVRMAQPMGTGGIFSILNMVWGVAPELLSDLPNFNDFSALMRIEHVNHNYDVYDGTVNPATGSNFGYQNVATELAQETWYEIWIKIDHNNSAFSVYIKGGPEFPEQVQAYPAVEGEMVQYRNKTFDPMANFMIIATVGVVSDVKSVDNFYVDDIYVDTTGYNLESPLGGGFGSWGPWDIIDEAGNVDTGGWLNFVNIAADPYVYVYNLDQWMYIDEAGISAGGGWSYIFKY